MKNTIIRLTLFLIPFGIYLIIVLVVDPYNYTNSNTLIENELKKKISCPIQYPLWKLNDFENEPSENIILGDSRMYHLTPLKIKENTGMDFKNLAYGGGTLQEVISTFWETSKSTPLKNVYIGLNFNLYNAHNKNNRVDEAIGLKNNFFAYALNRYTFKATFYLLKAKILNEDINIEAPNMNKENFWNYQLAVTIKSFYAQYSYPKNYFDELKKITLYCKKNNINLVFFIPPTHIELQNKIAEFNLTQENERFLSDINQLSKVYNLDIVTDKNKDKDNFKDPFHLNNNLMITAFNKVIKQEQGK